MNIDAGELNKKISIISKIKTQDPDGYDTITENVVRSCWAKFTRTSGTEAAKANADFADIKARFLVRYSKTPVDRKMIVRYGGNDYEIVYINDYEDSHEYIEIWCSLLTLGAGT